MIMTMMQIRMVQEITILLFSLYASCEEIFKSQSNSSSLLVYWLVRNKKIPSYLDACTESTKTEGLNSGPPKLQAGSNICVYLFFSKILTEVWVGVGCGCNDIVALAPAPPAALASVC